MDSGLVDYLRLHEAVAKTNSPDDQPPFTDMAPVFDALAALPPDGNMAEISEAAYDLILNLARKEISGF